MLATLVDSTYPWRFVSAGTTALAVLLLAMFAILYCWSNRRTPEGPRLLFCIMLISMLLPCVSPYSLLLLVWISERLRYDILTLSGGRSSPP